ncbi:MAG: anaerobic ribonucleoside-triphosphate reductase activating protein [Oscillospiraceae bacterium]|nr:anaerobic ribonucleoside-triphosphate reductase activating protein [Oscillospiraceae bacterium]
MNYATIKSYDVANGPGVRVSLFVSGCTHHCRGCFNAEAWDFNYGKPFNSAVEDQIIEYLRPWYIRGFSLLGGEPFEPANQAALLPLMQRIRRLYPEKNVWCYTGYDYELDILAGKLGPWEVTKELLRCIDILVDGEFIEAEKDLTLRFKGSRNQRIIDVRASHYADEIVLWDPENEAEN